VAVSGGDGKRSDRCAVPCLGPLAVPGERGDKCALWLR